MEEQLLRVPVVAAPLEIVFCLQQVEPVVQAHDNQGTDRMIEIRRMTCSSPSNREVVALTAGNPKLLPEFEHATIHHQAIYKNFRP